MPNITLSIDEELLKTGREYAKAHNVSLNALIRKLLHDEVEGASAGWMKELVFAMKNSPGNSGGEEWSRGDLYDV